MIKKDIACKEFSALFEYPVKISKQYKEECASGLSIRFDEDQIVINDISCTVLEISSLGLKHNLMESSSILKHCYDFEIRNFNNETFTYRHIFAKDFLNNVFRDPFMPYANFYSEVINDLFFNSLLLNFHLRLCEGVIQIGSLKMTKDGMFLKQRILFSEKELLVKWKAIHMSFDFMHGYIFKDKSSINTKAITNQITPLQFRILQKLKEQDGNLQ